MRANHRHRFRDFSSPDVDVTACRKRAVGYIHAAVFNSRDAAVAHTPVHIVGECAIRYTFFHRSPTRLLFLQPVPSLCRFVNRSRNSATVRCARFIKRKRFLFPPFCITRSSPPPSFWIIKSEWNLIRLFSVQKRKVKFTTYLSNY